jgi:hypothetical protein
MKPLSRIIFENAANEAGTDKAKDHGYHRFYPLFLSQLERQSEFTIVEIGYGNGASILMWKTLFPNAYLICIDRDISEEADNHIVIQADQSRPDDLMSKLKKPPYPVKLVVDDGSHHPRHQLACFSTLFEQLLEDGGFYIIEDIETSYWLSGSLYGYEMRFGLFCRWSAIEAFKLAVDYTNRKYLSDEDKSLVEYSMMIANLAPSAAKLINSITFGQICALINKTSANDSCFTDSPYFYADFTNRSND